MIIPKQVDWIIQILQENGYEAYAVGGCVRDRLLGREPSDWDITTSARPEQVKALFRRTIDTGIEHGTVTVMVEQIGYEVTTYRLDGDYVDHRHPKEVVYTQELIEDLKRRDFTINAMAYNKKAGLVDAFGGQEDIEKKKIRAVGNPVDRFNEDALRMLRAIRFAGQIGFEIEEETQEAICKIAPTLSHVSQERIRVELTKLICSKGPELLFTGQQTGLTKIFLPEFDQMCETTQKNPHHSMDVAHHSIVAVAKIRELANQPQFTREKDRVILAFAALLHDVAKPEYKTTDEKGIDHFYGHDLGSGKKAEKILQRLKFDNETIRIVKNIIQVHDNRYEGGKKSIRRVMNRIGRENMKYLFALQEADLLAQSDYMREEKLVKLKRAIELYHEICQAREAVTVKELAVTGNDLMKAGVKPGPKIGELLNQMLEAVLEDPTCNTKGKLMDMIK